MLNSPSDSLAASCMSRQDMLVYSAAQLRQKTLTLQSVKLRKGTLNVS